LRILLFTAGAASMYCGSCLRDNTLAAELLAAGEDVTLVPLYTPTLTDEPNVSQERVFFGGISMYLEQHAALFRKTPWLLDRLWDSKFALQAASKRSIAVDPKLLGELTVSILRGEDGYQRKEIQKLLKWLETEPAPDVVAIPFSLLIALAEPLKRALHRPVCCSLQADDLFIEGLREPYRTEALDLIRRNVGHVDAYLPVSRYYAEFMSEYLGIPPSKMHVVPLGIHAQDFDPAPRPRTGVFTVGFFARVAPEKGLHVLADAYHHMRRRPDCPPARLEVAGYLGPEHRAYFAGIQRQMKEWGLGGEFRYHGSPDRSGKIAFLKTLDVFSMPAPYAEPKGLSVLEAMASGIPVVQPHRGAFPEMLEAAGGGILVPPDDPEALAEALLAVWKDPGLARELARRGAAGVREHYGAERMAARAMEVFARLTAPVLC
jgi:glycosyltransferase involved in cell wall biosynthesis